MISIYAVNLESQSKFGCESLEKKEEYAQSRKQYQEQRRKIDNYEDQYFHLVDELNGYDTEGNLLKKWHE